MEVASVVANEVFNYATQILLSVLTVVIATVSTYALEKWEWLNLIRSEESIESWAQRATKQVLKKYFPEVDVKGLKSGGKDVGENKFEDIVAASMSELQELAPKLLKRGKYSEKNIRVVIEELFDDISD